MSKRDEALRKELRDLRDQLKEYEKAIQDQQQFIQQLTTPPLLFGTVISLSRGPHDFVAGTRVRLKAGAECKYRFEGEGTVVGPREDKRGQVIVEFDHQNEHGQTRNAYLIGLPEIRGGLCELEFVEEETSPPAGMANIVCDGKTFQVNRPPNLRLSPGDTVTVSPESKQIVGLTQVETVGDIAYVREIVDDKYAKVDTSGDVRVVMAGKFGGSLEKGDQVILDPSGSVMLHNLGRQDDQYAFAHDTGIDWDDIGGLELAKRELINAFETPQKHPEVYARYNKHPIKGALLYGPPGNGKTMLGKAVATSVARTYGHEGAPGFFYVKGPEILTRYVGDSEGKIRQLFAAGRHYQEQHGFPAVFFIDEADSILQKRGTGISSDVNKTIVPMFLVEMDGLLGSGAIVILATNRPDIIDPAVVRDGRIDLKIRVGRPNEDAARMIFRIYLKDLPLDNGYTHEDLAELGTQELFSPRRAFYRVRTVEGEQQDFLLRHTVSGAMIRNVVDIATGFATDREIATGTESGLGKEDLVAAVETIYRQGRDLDHTDELADFRGEIRGQIKSVHRLVQGAEA